MMRDNEKIDEPDAILHLQMAQGRFMAITSLIEKLEYQTNIFKMLRILEQIDIDASDGNTEIGYWLRENGYEENRYQ